MFVWLVCVCCCWWHLFVTAAAAAADVVVVITLLLLLLFLLLLSLLLFPAFVCNTENSPLENDTVANHSIKHKYKSK